MSSYKIIIFALITLCFKVSLFAGIISTPVKDSTIQWDGLAENINDEIEHLVQDLKNDPVEIYNWVYENIDFTVYKNAAKGAQATYETRNGNSWDTTSLLVAMMRTAGFKADYRYLDDTYVCAEVTIPITYIRGWGEGEETTKLLLAPWIKQHQIDEDSETPLNQIDVFEPSYFQNRIASNGDHMPQSLLDSLELDKFLPYLGAMDSADLTIEFLQNFLNKEYGLSINSITNTIYKLYNRNLNMLPLALPRRFQEKMRDSLLSSTVPISHIWTYDIKISSSDRLTDYMYVSIPLMSFSQSTIFVAASKSNSSYNVGLYRDSFPISTTSYVFSENNKFSIATHNVETEYISVKTKFMHIDETVVICPINDIYNLKNVEHLFDCMEIDKSTSIQSKVMTAGAIFSKSYVVAQNRALKTLYRCFAIDRTPQSGVGYFYHQPSNDEDFNFTNAIGALVNYKTDIRAKNISPIEPFGTSRELNKIVFYTSSLLEGKIYEDYMGASGLSTMHVLRNALQQNINLLTITSSDIQSNGSIAGLNLPSVPSDRQYTTEILNGIIIYLNEGGTVLIPEYKVEQNDYFVTGYFVDTPTRLIAKFDSDNGGGVDLSDLSEADMIAINEMLGEIFGESDDPDNYSIYDWAIDDTSLLTDEIQPTTNLSIAPIERTDSAFAGDPVRVSNGDFYVDPLPDLGIPSRGELDLSIRRHYRSQYQHDGAFGYGWTFNHDLKVFFNNDDPDAAVFIDRKGNLWRFKWDDVQQKFVSVDGNGCWITKDTTAVVVHKRDGSQIIFSPDLKLLKQKDVHGNSLTYIYNINGNVDALDRIVDDLGRFIDLTYLENGKISKVTDFMGRSCQYVYSNLGDLIEFSGLEDHVTKYSYIDNGGGTVLDHNINKISIAFSSDNPNGDSLYVHYYKDDKVDYHMNDLGHRFHFKYGKGQGFTEVTDESGYYKKIFYNSYGDTIKTIDENSNMYKYEYDDNRRKIKEINPLGASTEFTYDDNDNIIKKRQVDLNIEWNYAYDLSINKVRYSTDPMGYVTENQYDGFDLVKIIRPSDVGGEASYDYDEFGNLTQEIDFNGGKKWYFYDANHLFMTNMMDSENNEWRYRRNQLGLLVQSTSPEGVVMKYEYNNFGQLTKSINGNDVATSVEYNSFGQKIKEIDGLGNVTQYNYSTARDVVIGPILTSIVDRNGNTESYEYDNVGNLVKKIQKDGSYYKYQYDGLKRLVSQTDPLGYETFYDYDAIGHLLRSYTLEKNGIVRNRNEAGYVSELGNSEYSIRYEAFDAIVDKKYVYDQGGRILEVHDAKGISKYFSYDKASQIITENNDISLGLISQFRYDSQGRIITKDKGVRPVGSGVYNIYESTRSTAHEYNNLQTKITDPLGNYKVIYKDHRGLVVEEKWFDQNSILLKSISSSYNRDGQLVEKIDGDGFAWCTRYNHLGQKIEEEDPEGYKISYQYDTRGLISKITDREGNVTSYIYDKIGNQIVEEKSDGTKCKKTFNEMGYLSSLQYASGGIERYFYDSMGRKTLEIKPEGDKISYQYDRWGKILSSNYSSGRSVKFEYDAIHRVIKKTSNNEFITLYNYHDSSYFANRNRLTITENRFTEYNGSDLQHGDSTSVIEQRVFNSFGELSYKIEAIGNANQRKTEYYFDKLGNVILTIDGLERTHKSIYDALGRLSKVYELPYYKNMKKIQYNGRDLVSQITLRDGKIISNEYNSRGEVILKKVDGVVVQEFEYTPNGQLKKSTDFNEGDLNCIIENKYDVLGRIESNQQGDRILFYEYNDANLTTNVISDSYHSEYIYDKNLRLTSAKFQESNYPVNLNWSERGLLDNIKYSNIEERYYYQKYGFELERTLSVDQNVKIDYSSFFGTYGAMWLNHRGERTKFIINSPAYSFYNKIYETTSDALDRINKFAGESWDYDVENNWSTVNDGFGSRTFSETNSKYQYNQVGNDFVTYTEHDEVDLYGINDYDYDWNGRLIKIKKNGILYKQFFYDTYNRITKVIYANGSIERRYYQGQKNIIKVIDGVEEQYIYGTYVDQPLLWKKNGVEYFFARDHRYSVIGVFDVSGDLVEGYQYSCFGKQSIFAPNGTLLSESAVGNSVGYQGRDLLDGDESLWNFRRRAYSSKLGRFLQLDPAGYVDGYNRYAFVRNNPLRWLDPSGKTHVDNSGSYFTSSESLWASSDGSLEKKWSDASYAYFVRPFSPVDSFMNLSARTGAYMYNLYVDGHDDGYVAMHGAAYVLSDMAGTLQMMEGANSVDMASRSLLSSEESVDRFMEGALKFDLLLLGGSFEVTEGRSFTLSNSEFVPRAPRLDTADPGSLMSRQGVDEMMPNTIQDMSEDMMVNRFNWNMSGPIDVAENDNGMRIIIDGHHRTQAAIEAGVESVPIRVFDVAKDEWDKLFLEAYEANGGGR